MDGHDVSNLTIIGGRPKQGRDSFAISSGLQALQRLAKNPSLARDLVADPEGTLAAEGLTLTLTELAILHHLDARDLEQAKGFEPTSSSVIA